MMKKILLLFMVIFIITSCSSDERVIQKVDPLEEDSKVEREMVEEENDDSSIKEEFIEFQLENEVIRLKFELVPILYAYLQASDDKKKMVKEMEIKKLGTDGSIYLIEFACNDNKCSYLLIDEVKEKPSFLVADLAKFENFYVSPNQNRIVLQFSRFSDQDIPLHHLIVIDVKNWKQMSFQDSELLLNYHLPLQSVQWIDDNTISVSLPDIIEPSGNQLLHWQESTEKNNIVIELSLDESFS